MLYDEVDDPGETSPADLRAKYLRELAAVVDEAGVDAVADETGVDRETVAAIAAAGDDADAAEEVARSLRLKDAAAMEALADDALDGEDVLLETRDDLLMGMTTAVLDVDTIAAEIDADLDGKQIQQKIEGRSPMSLDEYVTLKQFIASRQR